MNRAKSVLLTLAMGLGAVEGRGGSIEVPINGTLQKVSEAHPVVVWNAAGEFRGTFFWQSDIFAETAPNPSMVFKSSNYFVAHKYESSGDVHGSGRIARDLAVDVSNWTPGKSYYVTVSQPVNFRAAKRHGSNQPQEIAVTLLAYCVGGATLWKDFNFVDVHSMNLTEHATTAAFTVPPQKHCTTGLMHVYYMIQTMRAVRFKPLAIAISEIGS